MSLLQQITDAQNAHDAVAMAACFAEDYQSAQPVHPGRDFRGRAQVLANWTAVFDGVPDFHAELLDFSNQDETEWGEVAWTGSHRDGSPFAMRGVIIVVRRDGLIAEGRLYVEPVEAVEQDIEAAVEELFHPPAEQEQRPSGATGPAPDDGQDGR